MSDERLDHGSLVAVPLEVEIHVERLRRLVGQKPQRLVERDRIRGQLLVGVPENEPPVRCIDHVELDHVDTLSDRRGQRSDRVLGRQCGGALVSDADVPPAVDAHRGSLPGTLGTRPRAVPVACIRPSGKNSI